MKETNKTSWGQAAAAYDFESLLNTLLGAEDEADRRETIKQHPIALSYAFLTYCLDMGETLREQYNNATRAASQQGSGNLSTADRAQLKKYQHDLKQLKTITKTVNAVSVENYVEEHPRQPPVAPQPTPVVPPPAPATATLDSRLTGLWEYSKYSSAGGFSMSSSRTRMLGRDGRFVDAGQTVANMTDHDSSGNETGRSSADSGVSGGVSADERGAWHTAGNTLRLDWDSGDYATFTFEVSADGLLLTPIVPKGEARYWARKS